MKRNLLVCASLLLAAACGLSDKEQQANAEQGQRESDQNATRVERAFDDRRAELDRETNEKTTARGEFQMRAEKSASELDHKIDQLKGTAQKANGNAAFDTAMRSVEAKRADLDSELRSIDSQQAQQFDTLKTKVDGQLEDLKKSVEVARNTL